MDSNTVNLLNSTPLFDAAWYLGNWADLSAIEVDAASHYLTVGWAEGRNPSPFFDGAWYLRSNLDVAAAGVNPLLHYVQAGEAEGRWPCRIFDPTWYSQEYGVTRGEGRAFAHYLTIGRNLNLKPNEVFDPMYYMTSHLDLREAEIDPMAHYLEQGYRESRKVAPGFSLDSYRENYLGGVKAIDPIYHYLTIGKRRGCHFSEARERPSIADEMRTFTNPGPDFEEFAPNTYGLGRARAKLIAFYLPQFHSIPENDAWWGKGFTEWRNTQRGVPRFVGHYQPRIPRDLGFYDLSNPAVLARQIEMARQAGIHGFCFYYYNFDGTRVLEQPIEQFLTDRSLDYPFCIMWANENWTRRWDGADEDVLIKQSYHRENEDAMLADWCRHFDDSRYIKADGRPLLLIYRPGIIPNAPETIARWRERLAEKFGQHPWILMSQSFGDDDPTAFNLDGAFEFPPHKLAKGLPSINSQLMKLDAGYGGTVVSYEQVIEQSLSGPSPPFPLIKSLCPSWDNDCRRQGKGLTLHGSSPGAYQRWLGGLVKRALVKPFAGEPFIFVNAWNEWAEAAYLEPDVHYGAAYLNATSRALTGRDTQTRNPKVLLVGHDALRHGAQINLLNLGRTLKRQFGLSIAWLLLDGGALIDHYREVGPVTIARPESRDSSAMLDKLRHEGFRYAITNTLVVGCMVPELCRAGFRVVSLVHELPGLASEYKLETEARAIADCSHAIVCAAEMVARGFRDFAGKQDVTMHILPQGLYAQLPDVPGARELVRHELGLLLDTKIVIGVGFADLRKGIDLFIQTAAFASERDPKMIFLWVGDLHQSLERKFPENLRHVGFTNSISRYLRAADAMFLSSREDPFPSVVLEALACGLPVVGFAGRSGTEDLIREHGAIVASFDVEAAVNSLRQLMALDGKAASDAATRRRTAVTRDFDYNRFASKLLQLLNPGWPRISVVVPNYNYARYLSQRLHSIFAQSVPIYEIIVLDDASTDDSVAVLERIRQECNRDFILIRNTTNSGSSVSQWLKGVEQASGDLVWIAEADDVSDPLFLERLIPHFERQRTLFAYSDSAQIDSDGVQIGDSYHHYYTESGAAALTGGLVMDARSFAERFLSVQNLILNVSAVLARRQILIETLRDSIDLVSDYSFAGDWHLYASACLRDGDVAYVAEPLNIHRRHRDSATHVALGTAHIAEVERVHAFLEAAYESTDNLRHRRQQYIALLRNQFGLTR